ncbi:MAG: catM 2 [Firmicutes bacterium]|nr:catM 2 [Bacillota bacterium]
MDIRQLKYFLAIAEEGQITRAAKRLNITQPPLSQQIISLEKELGLQLFDRGKTSIRLTQAGTLLQTRAQQLLELLQTTVNELQETANGISGRLTIGTITSSSGSLLPENIKVFHKMYPKVTFHIRQGETEKILKLLNLGLVEIGLVRFPVDCNVYDFIKLPEEGMVVAATEDVLVPGATPLTLNQLKGKPLLIHQRHVPMVKEYSHQAGFEPTILCTSDDISPLLLLANLGFGIALVPKSAINLLPASSLYFHELTPFISTTSAVIWSKKQPLSVAANHFIALFNQK